MRETRLITTESQITPHLEPVQPVYIHDQLPRRQSGAYREEFFTCDETLPDDEINLATHGLYFLTKSLHGVYGTLRTGTIVVQHNLVLPVDHSEEGLKDFVEARQAKESVHADHYAHILINEPRGLRKRSSVETIMMLETRETGRDLAAVALNHQLNNIYWIAERDQGQSEEILALHQKLGEEEARQLRAGIKYNF